MSTKIIPIRSPRIADDPPRDAHGLCDGSGALVEHTRGNGAGFGGNHGVAAVSRATVPRQLWYVGTSPGLPGFPDITVMAQPVHKDVYFDYSGWPEDLVAAGVMQPEWLTPTGKHLRDPDGAPVSVSRRWRVISPEAPPRRYCVVKRYRPLQELSRWPEAAKALEAYERWRMPQASEPPRPELRLVVNNTV